MDVFAFGMTVVDAEVCSSFREHNDPRSQVLSRQRWFSRRRSTFTGNVPFHGSYKVMNGEHPLRPHGIEILGLSLTSNERCEGPSY